MTAEEQTEKKPKMKYKKLFGKSLNEFHNILAHLATSWRETLPPIQFTQATWENKKQPLPKSGAQFIYYACLL